MSDAVLTEQEEAVNRINAALKEMVPETEQCGDHDGPWIVFSLVNREYAISARHVLRTAVLFEVIPYRDAPVHCPGVIWEREGMIRLLDLRALFGQGNYMSTIDREKQGLPMIIIIGIDGVRRGMIVDEILMIGHFGAVAVALTDEERALARYADAKLKCDCLEVPAPIFSPDSLRNVEFEQKDAKLDWKGYVDMRLEAEKLAE